MPGDRAATGPTASPDTTDDRPRRQNLSIMRHVAAAPAMLRSVPIPPPIHRHYQ